MVVIGVLVLGAIIAVLHLLLSRWMSADRARVAARRGAAAEPAPSPMTPEPDEEAEQQLQRLQALLDAIEKDEARRQRR